MKKKILFLSQFSEPSIREHIKLKNFAFRKLVAKTMKKSFEPYQDYAIWVSEYLSQFAKHPEYEFHFVGPHKGMKKKTQSFIMNGIHYHFFKSDGCYIYDVLNSRFHLEEKDDFQSNREKIKGFVYSINPDMIILCGAENPNYSLAITDINDKPVYVILQTLLNSPKRIEMGVGTQYRRECEKRVFMHASYFCTSDEQSISYIREINANAKILQAGFPTRRANVELPKEKDYDFVFFSRNVTSFKGIEDLLKALGILKAKYNNVSLNIIGGVSPEYKSKLSELIVEHNIADNVCFSGYYLLLDETYLNVVKAKAVVVPGITASLNSTIRESMLMGMPTICYETPATKIINQGNQCLLTAKMQDVDDLAYQMESVLSNPLRIQSIAERGQKYAEKKFSNEAVVNKLLSNCDIILNKV